jgi:hypothetical protein
MVDFIYFSTKRSVRRTYGHHIVVGDDVIPLDLNAEAKDSSCCSTTVLRGPFHSSKTTTQVIAKRSATTG